jgi:hypothetical protein
MSDIKMQFRRSGVNGPVLKFHYFDFIAAIEDGLNGYLDITYRLPSSASIDDIDDTFGSAFDVMVMPNMVSVDDIEYTVYCDFTEEWVTENYDSPEAALDRALELLKSGSA